MGMKYFEVCCAVLMISEWDGVFFCLKTGSTASLL